MPVPPAASPPPPGAAPEVSVLIATFNEAANIAACLEQVAAAVGPTAELIVIDGGHDDTRGEVERVARRLPGIRYVDNRPDRGKGHAIRNGIAHARGRLHAQIDADLQFSPADLPALLAPLRDGRADVVLGSRFCRGSGRDTRAAGIRTAGNHVVSAWVSLLHGRRLTDVLAGIKAWTADAAGRLDLRSDTYSYELEIPARALRLGLRVTEVPVQTRARELGDSKVSVVRVGLRALADALRFRCERR